MILPEIGVALNRRHYACWGADTLEEALPKVCPCCGAKLLKGMMGQPVMLYECGAKYTNKPQGQTHTDVYYGICPARVDPWICEKAGLAPDTPPGIVADKLADMGLTEEEALVKMSCKV